MSDAKHTAGPWSANFARINGEAMGWHITASPEGSLHAIALDGDSSSNRRAPAELEANGHLIAAAPDLLAALESCRKELSAWMRDHGDDIKTQEAVSAARAAKAKATGAAA